MSNKYQVSQITKDRFINIIKKSISNTDIDYSLFRNVDTYQWNELIFLSKIHTVEAIVFDEVLQFDSDYLPANSVCLKMFAEIERVKFQNKNIHSTLSSLSCDYNSLGLDFLFFKGPVCGMNYPNPNLRCIGDLDVFLYKKEDFDKANSWAISRGFQYHKDELKLGHWSFVYNGILIENHNNITFFENKKYNKRFEDLVDIVVKTENFYNIDIEGTPVRTLPIELNYLYIYLHLFYHFVHGGIGLRQYMDWIYWSIRYNKYINRDKFASICDSFDISYPIGLFARVAVDYFGVDKDIFPFDVLDTSDDSELIFSDLLECGNFGILNTDYWSGKWRGRLHKFLKTIKRSIKLYHISPEYSSCVPLYSLYYRIYLTFRGM